MADDGWLYAIGLAAVASGIAGLLVPLYLVRIGAGAPALGVSASIASLVSAPGVGSEYPDVVIRVRSPTVAPTGTFSGGPTEVGTCGSRARSRAVSSPG